MVNLSANLLASESFVQNALPMETNAASVSGYRFRLEDLRVAARKPGISAFMRIRNGADFLEATIRSHIGFFDEIVAVHNQCTDETPAILERLRKEFGSDKLRVIHYADRVYPQGTTGHARTHPTSPQSVVNYSNFALAATRYQYVTKLDDDHLAITQATQSICDAIRCGNFDDTLMYCFSGLNIVRRQDGRIGILARDPISGNGDIGFFRVKPCTYFCHDRRFERFYRGRLTRIFAGFLYWHMKYVKGELGFGNYELQDNPSSRFAKRKSALVNNPIQTYELEQLAVSQRWSPIFRVSRFLSDKLAFLEARDASIAAAFPDAEVEEAIVRTINPNMRSLDSIVGLIGRPSELGQKKVG